MKKPKQIQNLMQRRMQAYHALLKTIPPVKIYDAAGKLVRKADLKKAGINVGPLPIYDEDAWGRKC